MMATQATNVSVVIPVEQAIDRVKRLLFWPFDIGKWCAIGFCAWLAGLGQAGFRGNFNLNGRQYASTRTYVMDNLVWIVPLAIGVIFVVLVLALVMQWVSSRGKFMFLHCVALNRAEIAAPWRRFAREGNSLFLFRFGLWLIGMALAVPPLAFIVVMVARMIRRGHLNVPVIFLLLGIGIVLIVIGIILLTIAVLTTDFVVPIMFLRGQKCLAAWRELRAIMGANPANFVLYALFKIMLGMAMVMMVLMVVIATCCCAGCLMMIPYVGTVLILPLLVFQRAYSVHYLAQYGREYDVFPPDLAPI
jgi:hypothetical protein